jgi:AcrR family transcriptional regulator
VARTASTTRSDQTAHAKQRILEVAGAMFAEHGYEGTAMQDVAKELGLTRAALYYHYASKADILREIIDAETTRFSASLETIAALGSRTARVEATVAALVSAGLNQRRRIVFFVSDPASTAQPHSSAERPSIFDEVAKVIYGNTPAPEQLFAVNAAFMVFAALPSFGHLSDEQLSGILTRALHRLLLVR